MKIKDIGGEFALIKHITREVKGDEIIVGIGDDAAVLKTNKNPLCVTTDSLVEGDHFSFDYFLPFQVGIKAIESSVSDIIAMGGIAKWGFVSLCLTEDIEVDVVKNIYQGIYHASDRCHLKILGGDTTHSNTTMISLTIIGQIEKEIHLTLRSGACVGDLIYVSGVLGGSAAGLRLLLKNTHKFQKVKDKHLEPKCRIDIGDKIAEIATSMTDISDGLISEINNICNQSSCGANIESRKIPLFKQLDEVANLLGEKALDYALYGGEDFELLYTIPKSMKHRTQGTLIGEIIKGQEVLIDGKKPLRSGYDHFSR